MARFAFRLCLRADRIREYEAAHRQVWPEMLELLKDAGICQYSIFRRGVDLFFYLHADDFDLAWSKIAQSPVNERWKRAMAPFFEPSTDLEPGERFPMMREVFYLE